MVRFWRLALSEHDEHTGKIAWKISEERHRR